MPRTSLRVAESELHYEGALSRPIFAVFDAPGRLYDSLLDRLASFSLTPEDLAYEDGEPGERAITCRLEKTRASVAVYPDRLELELSGFRSAGVGTAGRLLDGAWEALEIACTGVSPREHSVQFELDAEIVGEIYQAVLRRLAPAPEVLPAGTETALVYYLPAEATTGCLPSSLVLNRSARVERGLSVIGTLVYDGAHLKGATAIETARQRLDQLLCDLEFDWIER